MVGLLDEIEYFIFDVDGTLLLGKSILPFAKEVITLLQKREIAFTILSNNSSYSIKENQTRLEEVLNVKLCEKNIFTSTHSTIEFLLQNNLTRNYILGTPGFISDLMKSGIEHRLEDPQAILLGFDKTLNYEKIKQASLLLQRNDKIPFYATHPDDTCPTEEGNIPDVGSFLKMFQQATGRTVDLVFGKPNELILRSCLMKAKVDYEKVLVIGDRLETDIKMADSVGIKSALVLTGETSREDLKRSKIKPTEVWKDLEELLNHLENILF